MTQSELLQMLDHNTRKFLNIDVQEFLRRREVMSASLLELSSGFVVG
jgi:hypothetical protein